MTAHRSEKVVRIIKNWKSPDLMRQTPGMRGVWDGVRFTLDPVPDPDYVLVLNYVPEPARIMCSPDNVWAMLQEPFLPEVFGWLVQGHEQFARVISPHVLHADHRYVRSQACLPWHVQKTYDELAAMPVPEKPKELSAICSNKDIFPGHRKRLAFVHALAKEKRVAADLFGFGIAPLEDKWDALAPYKYSVAIENSFTGDYWTEKIADCFLAYTLPIYYGCPGIEKYFPEGSFIRIDIDDHEAGIRTIEGVLEEDPWESRVDALREARDLVLNKYQLFPFIAGQIHSQQVSGSPKKVIHLQNYDKSMMLTERQTPKISVVVCTYNRVQMLSACLQSLVDQTLDRSLYEVIVVNNNSSDTTGQVARDFVSRYPHYSYVEEPRQGLSHARNTGYQRARATYVAYVDDDARVPPDWLETALKIIVEKQPDIFGGPVYPLLKGDLPPWFKEAYAVRGDMGESGWLKQGFIVGTNLFIRKSLLDCYGGFDPDLGMKGNAIGYHEETALINRAFREGKTVFYARELAVKDLLPDYKLSLVYHLHARYMSGRDRARLDHQAFTREDFTNLIELLDATFREFDVALRQRDISRYPHPENYIIEKLRPNIVAIGTIVGSYRRLQEEGPGSEDGLRQGHRAKNDNRSNAGQG